MKIREKRDRDTPMRHRNTDVVCPFARGEKDFLTAASNLARHLIDFQRAECQQRARHCGHPALNGVNARGELAEVKRLEDVIIGPRVEAFDTIPYPILRGDNDHRNVLPRSTDGAKEIETIAVGQVEVQEDQVISNSLDRLGCRVEGLQPVDGVDLLEMGGDSLSQQGLVFDQQDPHVPNSQLSPKRIPTGEFQHPVKTHQ